MRARRRFARAVVAWAALAGAAFAQEAGPLRAKVDRLAKPLIEGQLVPGLAVGVLDAAGPRSWGYGRLGGLDRRVPDGRTVFEIGSVSNAFTGVLLAVAVHRAEAELQAPFARYLPPAVDLAPPVSAITLLDLTTHTSGLPRMPSNFAPADRQNPYADYTVPQMYAFLQEVTLLSPPGTRYRYSNLGAGLLGHCLGRAAKQPYAALLRERITVPLKMADTVVALTPALRRRLALGHSPDGDPAHNWDLGTLVAAGGIRSTADDMLRFAAAVMGHGTAPASLRAAMRESRTARRPRPGGRMGLGWHLDAAGDACWHNGQTGGYHAYVRVEPSAGRAVVVLANAAVMQVDGFGRRVMQALAGGDPRPQPVRVPTVLPAATLERYTGRFRLAPTAVLTVTRRGDRLYAQMTGQRRFRIYAESETAFFWRVVAARVEFRVVDGTCNALVIHQNGRDTPGTRMPR